MRAEPIASVEFEPFRWQGFEVLLPPEWAPVALIGDRKEGYCRFGSPGSLNCQIRWKSAKPGAKLKDSLFSYFRLLQKESKKAKTTLSSEFEELDGRIHYKWRGHARGRGELFFSETCSRVFFIEVVGTKKDSLAGAKDIVASFRSEGKGGKDRWSVLGLKVCFPSAVSLDKRQFQAGRTILTVSAPGFRAEASRWGFGEQLVKKHGLEPWARAAFGLGTQPCQESENGLVFDRSSFLGPRQRTLVRLEKDLNQITAVKATFRKPKWRPEWDWLDS